MTIRFRLLSLLLPILTTLVGLIALFFYFNWSHEILDSFKTRLKSVVIATAQSIQPEEIKWIQTHLQEFDLVDQPRYQNYRQSLVNLKQQLPINNLYIVNIEPINQEEFNHLNTDSSYSTKDQAQESEVTYKQVFLLDASHSDKRQVMLPGDIDFSETEENKVYFNKKPLVTPIYKSRKTGDRFMSAYAPILDAEEKVLALLGADVSVEEIERKLKNALLMIIFSTLAALLMIVATVLLVANKISKPVQQLNQAALDIAAGNYETHIQLDGPKEIVELTNTFNTMSECLVENISRLKESSLVRERMYGEYECANLLQHYMLQKVIEEFNNPHLSIRLTSVNLSNVQKGLLLNIDKDQSKDTDLSLTMIETQDSGFSGLYELNKTSSLPIDKLEDYAYIQCCFKKNYTILTYQNQNLFLPLVWSIKSQQFIKENQQNYYLNNQDMIFLFNSGLIQQFQTLEKIENWFAKILRHFSEDGLDTIHTMLSNELNFLAKRENLKRNFQILSIQVKITEIP